MKAFVTGSRAYGQAKDNSDIDLVVHCSREDYNHLCEVAENHEDFVEYEGGGIQTCLRFGNLNLIIAPNKKAYKIWRVGTEYLKKLAPVTRVDAIEHFRKLRDEFDEWF